MSLGQFQKPPSALPTASSSSRSEMAHRRLGFPPSTPTFLGAGAAAAAAGLVLMISGPPNPALAAALRCWAAVRSSRLVPRYVFAAINFIILAVLILSDRTNSGDLRHRRRRRLVQSEEAPATSPPAKLEIWTDVLPSPKLTDLDSTTAVAVEETPSGSFVKKIEDEVEEGDTVDATREAIAATPVPVQRSEKDDEQEAEAPEGSSGRWFGRSETFPSKREGWMKRDFTIADEQDRRFEAFIRATYEQMRMQKEESLIQRRQIQVQVAN